MYYLFLYIDLPINIRITFCGFVCVSMGRCEGQSVCLDKDKDKKLKKLYLTSLI